MNKLFLRMTVFIVPVMFYATGIVSQETSDFVYGRAKAGDFIIFPWGGVPTDFTAGTYGDMSSPADLMKDLFDCGYNTTGFIPAKYVPAAVNCRLAAILYDQRIASHPEVTFNYK